MDSGNSGSLQSSSGGDEEYDSRADSISAFMNQTGHVGPISGTTPPPAPSQGPPSNSTAMFDSVLSNYFQPMSRPPAPLKNNLNSILSLDMAWSKNLRSEPSSTEIDNNNNMLASPHSSSLQALLASQNQTLPLSFPHVTENTITATTSNTSTGPTPRGSDQTQAVAVRNPKKRSRASRRAPTTVLTTDTTNFRAMVQEFTGIPAPPFTSSPFPIRGRLDLFGAPASSLRSNPLDTSLTPPYLRRPFPQKLQQTPPPSFLASASNSLLSSSMVDHAIASSNTSTNNNISSGSSTGMNGSNSNAAVNYQLPPDFLKQPPHQGSSIFNMQNPVSITSLLQSDPAILGLKSQGSSMDTPALSDSHLKMGVIDGFGLGQDADHLSASLRGLPNLISPDQTAPRNDHNLASWGDDHGGQVKPANGSYNFSTNATSSKLNYSASSSDFRGEKGSSNAATRGDQGMMESWVCSSD